MLGIAVKSLKISCSRLIGHIWPVLLFTVSFFMTAFAWAQCASPVAPEGTREWFAEDKTYKLCNGTAWVPFHVPGESGGAGVDLSDGLLAHWMLDETSGTVAADSSGNGHNGTLNNFSTPAAWISGKINNALQFDGSNDRVSVSHHASFDLSSGYTFAAWVYFDSSLTGEKRTAIISKNDNNGTGWGSRWSIGRTSGGGDVVAGLVRMSVNHNQISRASGWIYPADQWVHAAVSWDGSTIRYHVNGNMIESVSASNAPDTSTGNLYLGYSRINWYDAYHNGPLDDVRLYNRVLSEAEIHALAGLGAPNTADDLVAHWTLDETSGTAVADSSPSGVNGIFVGKAAVPSIPGQANIAFDFDGISDRVAINDPGTDSVLDFGSGHPITIAAWIKPDTIGGPDGDEYQTIVTKGGTTGIYDHVNWQFVLDDYNAPEFLFRTTATGHWRGVYANADTIPTGVWSHVAFSYTFRGDILTARIYINGISVPVGSYGDVSGWTPDVTNDPLWIGASWLSGTSPTEPFDGAIDDVRIYRRTLSPVDIQSLMSNCAQAAAMDFDSGLNKYKFCDGTRWKPIACESGGGMPCPPLGACSAPRAIDYLPGDKALAWCDGNYWRIMAQ